MTDDNSINATMVRFGYPDTLIAEYDHWAVLLRPSQVTLGALVPVAKGPATAFSSLSAPAFAELEKVTKAIEDALTTTVSYDKINYLMLMMVDPHVHFHVLPRYDGVRSFAGTDFPDLGWPAPPRLDKAPDLADPAALRDHIKGVWPGL